MWIAHILQRRIWFRDVLLRLMWRIDAWQAYGDLARNPQVRPQADSRVMKFFIHSIQFECYAEMEYCTLSLLLHNTWRKYTNLTKLNKNQGYRFAPDATCRCNRRTAVNARALVSPPSAGQDQLVRLWRAGSLRRVSSRLFHARLLILSHHLEMKKVHG